MKKLTNVLMLSLLLSTSAFGAGKSKLTISRYEVKNILSMINAVDEYEIADCKSDSDCGAGNICVGIGICVPEAEVKILRSKLPNMMKKFRSNRNF
jgi:hypothetical protein